jgi:hypothetical protein
MSEVLMVPVVTAMPSKKYPVGAIEEGFYRVEGEIVSLVTAQGAPRTDLKGKPIQSKIVPSETAREVAWKLAKRHLPRMHSDFNRPLIYPRRGKI